MIKSKEEKGKDGLLDPNEQGLSELEKLKRENAKLMKMLDDKNMVRTEGMCTTCTLF